MSAEQVYFALVSLGMCALLLRPLATAIHRFASPEKAAADEVADLAEELVEIDLQLWAIRHRELLGRMDGSDVRRRARLERRRSEIEQSRTSLLAGESTQ